MPLPLEGVKIVDCTVYQNGPQATVMLADMGASVIKIEQPEFGDPHRWGLSGVAFGTGLDPYMEAHNRHKKSVTVDLRTQKGKEIIFRLVRDADVFVQNFRVGVMEKWGLGFKDLSAVNPKIIYASNSGLGPEGPERTKPVLDIIGQARAGLMVSNADVDGTPKWLGSGLADQVGAMWFAFGISMALMARERFGIAQQIEVSQLGSAVAFQGMSIDTYLLYGRLPAPIRRDTVRNPLWNVYKCGDGKWLVLACLTPDRFWPGFCRAIGMPELEHDARFSSLQQREQRAGELVALLDSVFARRGRDEWVGLLEAEQVMCSPANDYADVTIDAQVLANDYITSVDHPDHGEIRIVGCPVHLSETPPNAKGYSPELGQHTEEVLLAHGYSWEDIAQLREERVI